VRTLDVGDVLFIPAGVIHSATNTGAGNGTELATYIVEKGKLLVTVVK
jgi:quercetin dioxygenase-like cupin family protein